VQAVREFESHRLRQRHRADAVGVVVGGTLGTVVGALGAAAAGKMTSPEDSKSADPIPAPAHTKPSPAD